MRQPKGGTAKIGLGQIVNAVSIRERPAEAEDRAVPGHWEGDLLCGANNSHMVTLVERQSRIAMLIKVQGKDTAAVVGALSRHVRKLPRELRRSLTWDRGKEMADHKNFTLATNVQVYLCDPRSPWHSVEAMRTPTARCASTSLREQFCRSTRRRT
jgi:transposase, IS30 family